MHKAYPEKNPSPAQTAPEQSAAEREAKRKKWIIIAALISGVVLVLAALGTGLYFIFRPETSAEQIGRIRDVFIIVVALESLLIGVAMIVLVVQLASLINLLQNEIRPILNAASETVNNLRGTAEFLGENVVEPVIKLNGYLAGLQRMLELMGVKRK